MNATLSPTDAPQLPITGRCLCGAVRFSSATAPIVARACWCRLCQYLAAGSNTVNLAFKLDGFTITGVAGLTDFVSVADSGNRMHRRFCATCGTAMFSEAESRPHLIVVRAGTLDDSRVAAPQMTIWIDAAPEWACFDPALPQHTGQGPPPPAR
jgi:hypothetical protein